MLYLFLLQGNSSQLEKKFFFFDFIRDKEEGENVYFWNFFFKETPFCFFFGNFSFRWWITLLERYLQLTHFNFLFQTSQSWDYLSTMKDAFFKDQTLTSSIRGRKSENFFFFVVFLYKCMLKIFILISNKGAEKKNRKNGVIFHVLNCNRVRSVSVSLKPVRKVGVIMCGRGYSEKAVRDPISFFFR